MCIYQYAKDLPRNKSPFCVRFLVQRTYHPYSASNCCYYKCYYTKRSACTWSHVPPFSIFYIFFYPFFIAFRVVTYLSNTPPTRKSNQTEEHIQYVKTNYDRFLTRIRVWNYSSLRIYMQYHKNKCDKVKNPVQICCTEHHFGLIAQSLFICPRFIPGI